MEKIFVLMVFVAAGGLFAGGQEKYSFVNDEVSALVKDMGAGTIGALTVKDAAALAGRISIAVQKERYVRKSAFASMLMPGLGEFINHDALGGSLFLGTDIIVCAGTVLGAYFLLPANVQFSRLDYFYTPMGTVKTEWEKNGFLSYLPSIGVVTGGAIVMAILRHLSASHAAELAAKNIADGKVTFQPDFTILNDGMMMKMYMKF